MKKKPAKKLKLHKETISGPLRSLSGGYFDTFTCTVCACPETDTCDCHCSIKY